MKRPRHTSRFCASVVFIVITLCIALFYLRHSSFGNESANEHLYARALAELSAGQLEMALADFDIFIAHNSRNAAAYGNRGVAKAASGDIVGALTDLDRALEIDPRFGDAFFNRARIRAGVGDRSGAIVDYTSFISLNPKDPNGYYNRALLSSEEGDLDGARTDFSRVISLDPRDTQATAALAKVCKQAEDASAEKREAEEKAQWEQAWSEALADPNRFEAMSARYGGRHRHAVRFTFEESCIFGGVVKDLDFGSSVGVRSICVKAYSIKTLGSGILNNQFLVIDKSSGTGRRLPGGLPELDRRGARTFHPVLGENDEVNLEIVVTPVGAEDFKITVRPFYGSGAIHTSFSELLRERARQALCAGQPVNVDGEEFLVICQTDGYRRALLWFDAGGDRTDGRQRIDFAKKIAQGDPGSLSPALMAYTSRDVNGKMQAYYNPDLGKLGKFLFHLTWVNDESLPGYHIDGHWEIDDGPGTDNE